MDPTYARELAALSRDFAGAFGRVHRFAWKQGRRGGRYWLPSGKQDVPANRLYGAKAETASKASSGRGGEQTPRGGPKPGEAERVAKAKFEVARDAHAAAVKEGLPADKVAWLKARMEAAKKGVTPEPPPPARKESGNWVSKQYGRLRDRYGRLGAALTVAGMALPIPGTVVAAPLAAEAVYRTRKALNLSERG